MLDAQEAPAGQMEVVLAPGDSGILLHEAVGHGLEADFNRKGTSNYSGKIGDERRERPVHRRRRRDARSRAAARSTSTTRATSRERSTLIEKGKLVGYMHDRLSAKHFGLKPSGNGRRESFACAPMPRMTNTILLAGPHEPEEILREREARRLREEVRRRAGRHRQRRLRLLADRELPRRGREDHRAAQGREPHRQRARRASQGRRCSATTSR